MPSRTLHPLTGEDGVFTYLPDLHELANRQENHLLEQPSPLHKSNTRPWKCPGFAEHHHAVLAGYVAFHMALYAKQ